MNNFFQELRELLDKELGNFKREIETEQSDLHQSISYKLSMSGKRVRPLFTLIAADFFNADIKNALPAALSVELLHNFTLVHDDIMDNAPLRRNKPTVHEKWNTSTAILCGDALMIKAFEKLAESSAEKLPLLLNVFCKAAMEICEGQQQDMDFEKREKVSINEYLKMIELKTAVLLGASFKMGAIASGADAHQAEYFYEFGKNIGIAFQLQDDILDVFGDPEKFGKQVGGDIISNKKTFLLLKAKALATGSLQQELKAALANTDMPEKVAEVKKIYETLHIKALAEKEKEKYYHAALEQLDRITADPAKKAQLKEFTEGIMERAE